MSAVLRRVLLVDDDAGLLDALPDMIRLRLPDVRVETCASAESALQQLASVDYDAVITDIKMPNIDGLTLLAECAHLQPHTPVLLITGHGEHDLSVQALRGGAFDFIAKPIDREYFAAALSRALDVRSLRNTISEQQKQLEAHAQELETQVASRTEELLRANRAKDDFLGMISHEMRTPLTVISGGLTVLRSRSGSLSSEDYALLLEDAHRESGRLSRMVEDLLVLARADVKTVTDPEPISLTRLASKLAAVTRESTGRPVEVTAEPGLPLAAGDQTFIERVIENLLNNASKYSPEGSPIDVRLESEGSGRVAILVGDRGPGVSDEELGPIFGNFYRSPSAEAIAKGHGIGLAVCKRLVEAMSGQVFARNRNGCGLEVVVLLPVYRAGAGSEAEEGSLGLCSEPAAT